MRVHRYRNRAPLRAALPAALLLLAAFLPGCPDDPPLYTREQTDAFAQELRKTVDILLIIDNSCSMVDEQQKLSRNFDNFIDQFLAAEVDWQIGVVTTDMEDPTQSGRLVGETKMITSAMEIDEARALFEDNVKVCATGSGFERGLAAAHAALSEPIVSNENAGFLRDEAALSIVFVSDEKDLSALPVNEYLSFFKGLKGDPGAYRDDALVNLSAVVGPSPDGCLQPSPWKADCSNGLDDEEEDGVPDGAVDCEDDECATSWWCTVASQREESCDDGEDDDGDGAVDCADADCGDQNECRETLCGNGLDDDGDGQIDCADIDCLVDQPDVCGELSCSDGSLVHVGGTFPNFLLDCADPSCFTNPELEEDCASERAPIEYADRCEATVVFDPFTGALAETDGLDIDDATSTENELEGCDDPDCDTFWLCQGTLAAEGFDECGDCIDNDMDGAADCDDRDCLDSPYCDNPYTITPGDRYIDVAARSGGIVTSICAEEFSGIVRELGLNISGLRSVFYLSAWPLLGSIHVYLDEIDEDHEVLTGWEYDAVENRVLFAEESVPPAGTTVLVRYTRSSIPPTTQEGAGDDDSAGSGS